MTDTLKADDQSLTWLEEDRLHEECGVFGIFGHPDAAALTALGLHALQHRGQEAAGIVSFDGHHFHTERRLGLVGDHFTSSQVIDRLKGDAAIGHVRYSTCGDPIMRNVQPLFVDLASGGFALAHNGNLTNALTMRDWLITKGAICQSTTDTEVILHLVARSEKRLFVEKFIEALLQIEGAYALVGLTNKKLVGARDPFGIRPLVLGKLGEAWVLASETCALDIIGADFVREVENGEVVVITEKGWRATASCRNIRRGSASSNTSISPVPTRWSAAARSTKCARRWAGNWRSRLRPTPTSWFPFPIPACPRPSAIRKDPASPSNTASSAITMSGAPSSSPSSASASSA